MKQKIYNNITKTYALIGFIMISAIIISQILEKRTSVPQSFQLTKQQDSIESNATDTIEEFLRTAERPGTDMTSLNALDDSIDSLKALDGIESEMNGYFRDPLF